LLDINWIFYRYNCRYGPKDHSHKVLAIIKNTAFKKAPLDKKGKAIPKGKIKIQITSKNSGGSQKKSN
jgi:hypothetical protein